MVALAEFDLVAVYGLVDLAGVVLAIEFFATRSADRTHHRAGMVD